jgi:hypothetical protein
LGPDPIFQTLFFDGFEQVQSSKKRPEPQSPGRESTKMSGNCKKHDRASIL